MKKSCVTVSTLSKMSKRLEKEKKKKMKMKRRLERKKQKETEKQKMMKKEKEKDNGEKKKKGKKNSDEGVKKVDINGTGVANDSTIVNAKSAINKDEKETEQTPTITTPRSEKREEEHVEERKISIPCLRCVTCKTELHISKFGYKELKKSKKGMECSCLFCRFALETKYVISRESFDSLVVYAIETASQVDQQMGKSAQIEQEEEKEESKFLRCGYCDSKQLDFENFSLDELRKVITTPEMEGKKEDGMICLYCQFCSETKFEVTRKAFDSCIEFALEVKEEEGSGGGLKCEECCKSKLDYEDFSLSELKKVLDGAGRCNDDDTCFEEEEETSLLHPTLPLLLSVEEKGGLSKDDEDDVLKCKECGLKELEYEDFSLSKLKKLLDGEESGVCLLCQFKKSTMRMMFSSSLAFTVEEILSPLVRTGYYLTCKKCGHDELQPEEFSLKELKKKKKKKKEEEYDDDDDDGICLYCQFKMEKKKLKMKVTRETFDACIEFALKVKEEGGVLKFQERPCNLKLKKEEEEEEVEEEEEEVEEEEDLEKFRNWAYSTKKKSSENEKNKTTRFRRYKIQYVKKKKKGYNWRRMKGKSILNRKKRK